MSSRPPTRPMPSPSSRSRATCRSRSRKPRPRRRPAALAAAVREGGGGGGFNLLAVASSRSRSPSSPASCRPCRTPVCRSCSRLQILTDMQRPGAFKNAARQVTEEVQGGTMLSEALARIPKIWDRLYTNLVKAGETAGALEAILRRLAEFREKAQRLKKKVIGAMVYPIAVLTIAVLILTFIMIFIVPKFETDLRRTGHPPAGHDRDADRLLEVHR